MTKLKIADGLALPPESATKTFAILAQRRKGKTYAANVMAEEMVAAGQPWVALDPTSAWWGLRASGDGRKPGLPVVIIGGEHGDLPLERGAGQVIADLVVDEPGWYIIDLGHLDSKTAERDFATAFAERFYRRKAKSPDPVHLFVDEADMFVPQRSPSGDQRMLGAFEAIVRRGGIRGIGTTLISQRAAVVNKNVLEQIDVLMVLRVVGPNDQKAIMTYVDAMGTDEEKKALKDSMASLKLGEAWIWEPGAEPPLFERVQIRKRETFNSSATPKSGERKTEPKKLADVDLEALKGKIADTIERAKADDPKELKKQIAALKKELAQRPAEQVEVEKLVEVPALSAGDRELLEGAVNSLKTELGYVNETLKPVVTALEKVQAPRPTRPSRGGANAPVTKPAGGRAQSLSRPPAPRSSDRPDADGDLTGPEQRVLDALAWLDAVGFPRPSKIQVGFIAGYRVGKNVGGTFGNILGKLRGAGLIEYPAQGTAMLTETGSNLANLPDIEQTPEGLQRAVMERLQGPEQRVLQVLINAYPEPVTKQDCGAEAGYTVGANVGGTFGNILGRLRSLGLIDYPAPGEVVALPVLFLEES